MIGEAEVSLTLALEKQQGLEIGNIQVLEKLEKTFHEAFLTLGLTEGQEQEIIEFIQLAEQESLALFEKSTKVNSELKAVIDKFSMLKE